MFGLLIVLNIIICILLIIVILMQSSKGGGLAGSFGGANMGAVFGVRRTADFLSKVTTVLAIIFVVLTLMINFFFLPSRSNTQEGVIQSGQQQQSGPQQPAPQQPAPQQPNPVQSQPAAQPQNQPK